MYSPFFVKQEGEEILPALEAFEKITPKADPRLRSPRGVAAIIIKVLLVLLTALSVLWLLDIPIYLRIWLNLQQYLGIFLALILCLTFLLFPPMRGKTNLKISWYDVLFASLGLIVGLYITVFYPEVVLRGYQPTALELVLGTIAILLVLEAVRRTTGWILSAMGGFFIVYAAYCN